MVYSKVLFFFRVTHLQIFISGITQYQVSTFLQVCFVHASNSMLAGEDIYLVLGPKQELIFQ